MSISFITRAALSLGKIEIFIIICLTFILFLLFMHDNVWR